MNQPRVALTDTENDPVTRRLMANTLGDTEERAEKLGTLLGSK